MNPVLTAAVQPVLDDLIRCGVTGFRIGDYPSGYTDDKQIRAMLWAPDGSGTGISVYLNDDQAAHIADIAGVVQDIYVEDLSHTPWPRCPQHPAGGHPLLAVVLNGEAAWSCPVSVGVTCRVGGLDPA